MQDLNIKTYNIEKILQALYYLQVRLGTTNYLKLIKQIFFADRYHLRKYANLITYDNYVAMRFGPVCSQTYDIVKQDDLFLEQLLPEERLIIESSLEILSKSDIRIKPFEENKLSESNIEALQFSIDTFGKFSPFELANISHDYPEWNQYRERIESGKSKSIPMNVDDFFRDPDFTKCEFLPKYFASDPFKEDLEDLETAKNIFFEYA